MQAEKFPTVKVMGERASGTNFLEAFIQANFECHVIPGFHVAPVREAELIERIPDDARLHRPISERLQDFHHQTAMEEHGGWTHAALTDQVFERLAGAAGTLFLCIIRHPALWLRSFHRRPFHAFSKPAETLSGFLATPWITRPRDEVAPFAYEGPGGLWRDKVGSYLEHAARRENVLVLRHEDILNDPAATLERLVEHLQDKDGDWRMPQGHARDWQTPDGHPIAGQNEGRDFWSIRKEVPEVPWAVLDPDDASRLVAQIGAETIRESGYALPGAAG